MSREVEPGKHEIEKKKPVKLYTREEINMKWQEYGKKRKNRCVRSLLEDGNFECLRSVWAWDDNPWSQRAFEGMLDIGSAEELYDIWGVFCNREDEESQKKGDLVYKRFTQKANYEELLPVFNMLSNPYKSEAFNAMIFCGSFDQLKDVWRTNVFPWDRDAFDKMLLLANYDQLDEIWCFESSPWAEMAMEKMIQIGTMKQLDIIYDNGLQPWSDMAKEKMEQMTWLKE